MNDSKGRAEVVHKVLEHIQYALPTVFLLENVRGLKSDNEGRTYASLVDRIERMKDKDGQPAYKLKVCLLNSRDFGTPQTRNRLYFVGIRRIHMHNVEDELHLPAHTRPPDLE